MIRAPDFWQADGTLARLLAPLGAITAASTARRVARAGWQAPVPVFCCGNATLGGAGKTTLALDLAARLAARGRTVHVLSRGYGGRLRGTTRVDPALHDAAAVGDEPLLLARVAPCWIGSDRAASARAAIAAGAEVLVMDDGLQNPGLAGRHCALVLDGLGLGNRRLFPAGPMRETLERAAARCEIGVAIGPVEAMPPGLPILQARLAPLNTARLVGRDVHAFAGIGRPDKFFDTLHATGAVVVARHAFADHHRYRRAELDRLLRAAAAQNALLITTAKDWVRLPPALRHQLDVLEVTLEWDDPAEIERWLAQT